MPLIVINRRREIKRKVCLLLILTGNILVTALISHRPVAVGAWHWVFVGVCLASLSIGGFLHLYISLAQPAWHQRWAGPWRTIFWIGAIGLLLSTAPTVLARYNSGDYWMVLRAVSPWSTVIATLFLLCFYR